MRGLADEHPGVRRHAVRLSEPLLDAKRVAGRGAAQAGRRCRPASPTAAAVQPGRVARPARRAGAGSAGAAARRRSVLERRGAQFGRAARGDDARRTAADHGQRTSPNLASGPTPQAGRGHQSRSQPDRRQADSRRNAGPPHRAQPAGSRTLAGRRGHRRTSPPGDGQVHSRAEHVRRSRAGPEDVRRGHLFHVPSVPGPRHTHRSGLGDAHRPFAQDPVDGGHRSQPRLHRPLRRARGPDQARRRARRHAAGRDQQQHHAGRCRGQAASRAPQGSGRTGLHRAFAHAGGPVRQDEPAADGRPVRLPRRPRAAAPAVCGQQAAGDRPRLGHGVYHACVDRGNLWCGSPIRRADWLCDFLDRSASQRRLAAVQFRDAGCVRRVDRVRLPGRCRRQPVRRATEQRPDGRRHRWRARGGWDKYRAEQVGAGRHGCGQSSSDGPAGGAADRAADEPSQRQTGAGRSGRRTGTRSGTRRKRCSKARTGPFNSARPRPKSTAPA